VRAAGCVVTRVARDGIEILVVHRPRYDDWSLPKGKAEGGETPLATARREVLEETGLTCVVGPALPSVDYVDQFGRDKTVDYFLARAIATRGFDPDAHVDATTNNPEVDELCWLGWAAAARRVSRVDDRVVIDAAEKALAATAFVLLVRHAHAGQRSNWRSDDEQRPLSRTGRQQAVALAETAAFGARAMWSSPYVRCRQSLEPLAEVLEVSIEDRKFLAEGADPRVAYRALVDGGDGTVACSHGDVIGGVVDIAVRAVEGEGGTVVDADRCRKGSIWALVNTDARLVRAEYFRPLPNWPLPN